MNRLTHWKSTITGVVALGIGAFLLYIGQSEAGGLCILAGLAGIGYKPKK